MFHLQKWEEGCWWTDIAAGERCEATSENTVGLVCWPVGQTGSAGVEEGEEWGFLGREGKGIFILAESHSLSISLCFQQIMELVESNQFKDRL